jgi:Cu/Ag efflux pump CusA
MAMKLGTGAEQYAPMAKVTIGGLTTSLLLTVFMREGSPEFVLESSRSPRCYPSSAT